MDSTKNKIFEERKITIPNDRLKWEANLLRISDWRNGIAIAMFHKSSLKPSDHYYLIDKEQNYLFEHTLWNEEELDAPQIERVFGGYYIVRDLKLSSVRTFPGQDRDTEYYYNTCISKILDEQGNVLNETDKQNVIKTILYSKEIKTLDGSRTITEEDRIIELGENLIFRIKDSGIYKLSDFTRLSSLDIIKPLFSTFKDKVCKIYVEEDFRDFYVIVKDKKIIRFYDKSIFEEILDIVNPDFLSKEKKVYPERVIPNENSSIITVKPHLECEIDRYLYSFPKSYQLSINAYSLNYATPQRIKDTLHAFYGYSGFYYDNGICCKIDEEELHTIIDSFEEQRNNIPNYVDNIKYIRDIEFEGQRTKLYLFEIRPYGLLSTDGNFKYDFNISTLKL